MNSAKPDVLLHLESIELYSFIQYNTVVKDNLQNIQFASTDKNRFEEKTDDFSLLQRIFLVGSW